MEPGAVCWQTQARGFGWESHSGTHGSSACDVCGIYRCRCSSGVWSTGTQTEASPTLDIEIRKIRLKPFARNECKLSNGRGQREVPMALVDFWSCTQIGFDVLQNISTYFPFFKSAFKGVFLNFEIKLQFWCKCIYLYIYSKQPPCTYLLPPVPVTSSANEFQWVLPIAEVGRLAAHYTKWVSRELLCSCGKGGTAAVGLISAACSRIPLKQQTNKCALIQIALILSPLHPYEKEKIHSLLSVPQRNWKNISKCCKSWVSQRPV